MTFPSLTFDFGRLQCAYSVRNFKAILRERFIVDNPEAGSRRRFRHAEPRTLAETNTSRGNGGGVAGFAGKGLLMRGVDPPARPKPLRHGEGPRIHHLCQRVYLRAGCWLLRARQKSTAQ